VEYKNKSAASSNTGGWNRLNIIQEISEQHKLKVKHQGTTENSHIGHRKNISGSTNVNVHNMYVYRGKYHHIY
jgi:hypothetical protein